MLVLCWKSGPWLALPGTASILYLYSCSRIAQRMTRLLIHLAFSMYIKGLWSVWISNGRPNRYTSNLLMACYCHVRHYMGHIYILHFIYTGSIYFCHGGMHAACTGIYW